MDSLGSTREAGKDQLDSLEAPGRQERTIWQLARHQGGRKGLIGQSTRLQGGRKDHLDSLGSTREAGKDQLDSLEAPGINWTVGEAPRRQERAIWFAWEAPGRHQGDL